MRVFAPFYAVLISLALPFLTSAADDPSYNASLPFRPNNVSSLHDPYYWVGSYYNGTAELELMSFTSLVAENSSQCPSLANTTTTVQYDTILALTEPSSFLNGASDPVNAFLLLWDTGFDFSSITTFSNFLIDLPSLKSSICSSAPMWLDWLYPENYFNWALKASDPYRLSSTITSDYYGGEDSFLVNMTNCTNTEAVPWWVFLNSGTLANGTSAGDSGWPGMAANLEFDRAAANYTIQGYFKAYRAYGENNDRFGGVPAEGQFTLRFTGKIDTYHSDVLVNDTATPTWLRTVGFNNNSQNIGFTGAAGRVCSLADTGRWAALALVTQVVWLILN
ncbi:hypothetical protein PMG11_09329 [Penicillium brasilianum]|uniref:Peptidase A1 domain-containing protein n=1 Tax=Penicillium brasilianum TaxID=104259 RepID=A0A0F7U0G4_PENBI|nr:hypothetical protein PMG11_09329 [Penicillium brasilianum]